MVFVFSVPGWLEDAACNASSIEDAEQEILQRFPDACGIHEASEAEIKEISAQGGFMN